MMRKERALIEEKKSRPKPREQAESQPSVTARPTGLASLHRQIGNQGVQRLLTQRSSNAPTELDQETADRIDRERGSGQPLDSSIQARMGEALQTDLSEVRVHTSPEAHSLNQRLGAQAFTTGQDVFFRGGAYDPHSSAGQELITHELTHVVQQSLGAVGGAGRMTVNVPGDAYEQEADATAKAVTSAQAGGQVQRQEIPEEEQVQTKALQRQGAPEEEEPVQMQAGNEEEEEELQTKTLQRQEVPEEEEQL